MLVTERMFHGDQESYEQLKYQNRDEREWIRKPVSIREAHIQDCDLFDDRIGLIEISLREI